MNYIYDIILNFSDCSNYYEFYEWDNNDNFYYIDQIPIFRISSAKMHKILNYKIKISKSMLNKICNMTKTDDDTIKYSFLVSDCSKVLALRFDEYGNVIEISDLLLDEEDEVINYCLDMSISNFKIEKNYKYNEDCFLTRKEKFIQKKLLFKLESLYNGKCYDEIDYLYKEIYSNILNVHNEYIFLINDIKNNFDIKYEKIYNVIKLTE